jgi:hemolysin activation/secretion protein
LLRADDSSATVTLSADKKTFQNTSAQGLVMSDYQAKVFTAQVSGFYRDLNPGGSSGTYSLALSHGGINLDGSLSQQTDTNTVRTEGIFNKIRLNSNWQKALSTQTTASVSYSAQLSDKNLDSSEKMQLGGVNGVRAYPTGEGSGSDAQLIQLELRHQLESGINMSAFYDWGQVWLQHDPNYPGGPANNRNTYKGFGASVGYTTEDGINLKATWARKHGSNPNPNPVSGNDMDGTRDRNRYWLQVTVPF